MLMSFVMFRIIESSYNLAPEGLHLALERVSEFVCESPTV